MWSAALYSICIFGIGFVSSMHKIKDSEKLDDVGYRKLQPATNQKPTLFLDLKGTLVNSDDAKSVNSGTVVYRSGLEDFLIKMSEKFELIVFTRSTQEIGKTLVEEIEKRTTVYNKDRTFKFANAFYEEDCTFVMDIKAHDKEGKEIQLIYKDISHRGRELRNCILLDDEMLNFYTCGKQGVRIYRCSIHADDGLEQAMLLLNLFAVIPPEKRERLVASEMDWVSSIANRD